jgi:hypothetical protein
MGTSSVFLARLLACRPVCLFRWVCTLGHYPQVQQYFGSWHSSSRYRWRSVHVLSGVFATLARGLSRTQPPRCLALWRPVFIALSIYGFSLFGACRGLPLSRFCALYLGALTLALNLGAQSPMTLGAFRVSPATSMVIARSDSRPLWSTATPLLGRSHSGAWSLWSLTALVLGRPCPRLRRSSTAPTALRLEAQRSCSLLCFLPCSLCFSLICLFACVCQLRNYPQA